jgi:hypothetical protein
VRCEAEGIRRSVVSTFDETLSCGTREFTVSLYLDGDEGARRIAENFARREAAKTVQSSKAKTQSPWTALQR